MLALLREGGVRRAPPFKALESTKSGVKYKIARYLGRGASATVWEAQITEGSMARVAVKVFDQGTRDRRQAYRELKILARVSHPNILEAIEVVETSLYAHLVCQLVDGESLRAFAQRQPSRRLEEAIARKLYRQVVGGVSYCHDRLVAHRDLKLENLLLDRSCEKTKIIDFGFATQVATKDTKLRAFCGTPSYMAPEVVRGESYIGFSTDVWALGVVIFAMLSGGLPFAGRTELQLYAKIRRASFTIPEIVTELPRKLIRAALRLEAPSRPSCRTLLDHPWIQGGGPSTTTGGVAQPPSACSSWSGRRASSGTASAERLRSSPSMLDGQPVACLGQTNIGATSDCLSKTCPEVQDQFMDPNKLKDPECGGLHAYLPSGRRPGVGGS